MDLFNYRHSLKRINQALSETGHRVTHCMQSDRSVYTLEEKNEDGSFATCGFYYTATDVAEIANKLLRTN